MSCFNTLDITLNFQYLRKVSTEAKVRNRYIQVPRLAQDTTRESQKNYTQESQEVSPFTAGDHKTAIIFKKDCNPLAMVLADPKVAIPLALVLADPNVAIPLALVLADPKVAIPLALVLADPNVAIPLALVLADPNVAIPLALVLADSKVAIPLALVLADPKSAKPLTIQVKNANIRNRYNQVPHLLSKIINKRVLLCCGRGVQIF